MQIEHVLSQTSGDQTVSVTIGAIPIIYVDQGRRYHHRFAAITINFLRSGAPSVQIIFLSNVDAGERYAWFEDFKGFCKELQVGSEKFETEIMPGWIGLVVTRTN